MRRTRAVSTANLVHTREMLDLLLREKPACWPWAAFASVVFQRWAAVEERRVQQVLGTRPPSGARVSNGDEVAEFVRTHIRAADDIAKEAAAVVKGPAVAGASGDSDLDETVDGQVIVCTADQLGDFYVRSLELAEECRSCVVPREYQDLIGDCTRFMNLPLHDFGDFVNGVLERLEELQQIAMSGRDVPLGPVRLRTSTDDQLIWSILDRLQAISPG